MTGLTDKKRLKTTMTDAQLLALRDLAWHPETWWHDVPAGPRKIFAREGWLREVRKAKCNTRGHRHPGYVAISAKGQKALELENILRGRPPGSL